jgi:hypothetical protein
VTVDRIAAVSKALAGALAAFASSFAVAYTDREVSTAEWVTVAVATVVGFGGVWVAPANRDSGSDGAHEA